MNRRDRLAVAWVVEKQLAELRGESNTAAVVQCSLILRALSWRCRRVVCESLRGCLAKIRERLNDALSEYQEVRFLGVKTVTACFLTSRSCSGKKQPFSVLT
jgi:hypothetical protein